MQTFTGSLFLIFLVFVVVKCQDIGQTPIEDEPVQIMRTDRQSDDERWTLYKKTFNKVYPNFIVEINRRKKFEENVKVINSHNEKYNRVLACGRNPTKICLGPEITSTDEYSNTVGINQMSDLTKEEFLNTHLGLTVPEAIKGENNSSMN